MNVCVNCQIYAELLANCIKIYKIYLILLFIFKCLNLLLFTETRKERDTHIGENDYEGGLFSIHIQEATREHSAVPELLQ